MSLENKYRKDVIAFFYFFKDMNDHPVIKEAFRQVCADKLLADMYCDIEEYITKRIKKSDLLLMLTEMDSPFAELYKLPYPKLDEANSQWTQFVKKHLQDGFKANDSKAAESGHDRISLAFIEAKALVNWIYNAYPTMEERKDITKTMLPSLRNKFQLDELDFADCIIYIKSKVDINFVSSFDDFYNQIQDVDSPDRDSSTYYRGHADSNYVLLPSVMRSGNWQLHERDMYNELIIECPREFGDCTIHLDYLVHMQHYGLPTRLLDITRNPLVALYFACECSPDKNGEVILFSVNKEKIKYSGSDTVTVLASLPLFNQKLQQQFAMWAADPVISQPEFNVKAKRLLHEVKIEKPAFKDEIVKNDILDCFFILSEKRNNRIIKQDGAFIICGLIDKKRNPINNYRYIKNKKIQVCIIKAKAKQDILKVLNKFSINNASLFPEISDVTNFIKGKY